MAKISSKQVRNLQIGLQKGTERTIYARWTQQKKKKHFDHYNITWYYKTGNKIDKTKADIWFVGSDSTTKATNATYSAPSNAAPNGVKVKVTPVSKTHVPKKKKKSKAYWKGVAAWATYKGAYADPVTKKEKPNTTPSAPSNVEVEINGTKVTVKVLNYKDSLSNGKIHIQVVKDDKTVAKDVRDITNKLGLATYSFTGADGGTKYKARARASGKNGEWSAWSNYTANQTTAPAPEGAEISKLVTVNGSNVDVRWKAAKGAKSYTVGYTSVVDSKGNPTFDTGSGGQEQSDIKTTNFLAQSLELGKKWYFRLKVINDSGESGWSKTKNITIGTTPDKPTIWSYTTVGRVGSPIVLNWVHSSEDGSDQSGAVIGYKINNGAEQTIGTTASPKITTAQTYSFPTTGRKDGDKIRWRVRTRGTENIASPWGQYSEYREVVVYSPPSVSFTVGVVHGKESLPVIQRFPINIPITASPSTQKPVAYYISITADQNYDVSGEDGIEIHVSAGEEIYNKYIPTSSRSFTHKIKPGDVYLQSEISYTVTVTVAMTNGLTAESTKRFKAKWETADYDPDAEVTIDEETMTALIRPYCVDEWGLELKRNISLAVYRIDFDGNLTLIASGINPNRHETITDLHPSLDYARYRIVVTNLNTGTVDFDDLPATPVGANSAIIQWAGETRRIETDDDEAVDVINDWSGTILRLPYNIDVSDDISPDVSLVEYIGRKHPVSYYGTQQGSTSRWTAEFPKSDTETIAKIRALAIYPGDVYVREPYGTGYWAHVKVSYNYSHKSPVVSATFTITRVEGGA